MGRRPQPILRHHRFPQNRRARDGAIIMIRGSLIGLALGALITIPFLALAVFCAGGGHGTYAPAKFLFPVAMIFAVGRESITPPIIGLALVQFPLYGLI